MQEAVNHIAAACAAGGVQQVIICPGSRNAPLTMAFARHTHMECHSVVDERSAGFIAMGMAYRSGRPVVVVCTSGSAVANLYPAVVEAYYQRIPLIVISADRPPELIDQWDGQTIHQDNIFGKHVKDSYNLPDNYTNPAIFSNTVIQAFKSALEGTTGPVHINVPLREPLYTAITEKFIYPEITGIIYSDNLITTDIQHIALLQDAIYKSRKVLIMAGAQLYASQQQDIVLKNLAHKIPFIADAINDNAYDGIPYTDMLLSAKNENLKKALQPEVLITMGMGMVSKNVRLFLRQYKPKFHFHISTVEETADPFGTSPVRITGNVADILQPLNYDTLTTEYATLWQQCCLKIGGATGELLQNGPFSEMAVVKNILEAIPDYSHLLLANSMPIRWVNILGTNKLLHVWGNRGTSGIDGCVSTAVGVAAAGEEKLVTLITGDVAFFYDSNALWNKFAPANLRIIVLNNQGGGIFSLIDGPADMPELSEFLETRHNRTVHFLTEDYKADYKQANNFEELRGELETFFQPNDKPKVLEVFTNIEINAQFFKQYKQTINGLEFI